MKTYSGYKNCVCGCQFEWRYIKLQGTEVFTGPVKERLLNVINFEDLNGVCTFQIACPKCKKEYFENRQI